MIKTYPTLLTVFWLYNCFHILLSALKCIEDVMGSFRMQELKFFQKLVLADDNKCREFFLSFCVPTNLEGALRFALVGSSVLPSVLLSLILCRT